MEPWYIFQLAEKEIEEWSQRELRGKMADHLELVAEIPRVEKMSVQVRLEHAKKRRSQQLKRYDRDIDKEYQPPPSKKTPPVKFEPRIILLEATSRGDSEEGTYNYVCSIALWICFFISYWYCFAVQKMLDDGVDPNLANDDGLTALHQVLFTENWSLVFFVLRPVITVHSNMHCLLVCEVCGVWISSIQMFCVYFNLVQSVLTAL